MSEAGDGPRPSEAGDATTRVDAPVPTKTEADAANHPQGVDTKRWPGKGEKGSLKTRLAIGLGSLLALVALTGRGGDTETNDHPSKGFSGKTGEIINTVGKLEGREVRVTDGTLRIEDWKPIGAGEKNVAVIGSLVGKDDLTAGALPTLIISDEEDMVDFDALRAEDSKKGNGEIEFDDLEGKIGTLEALKDKNTDIGKLFRSLVKDSEEAGILGMVSRAYPSETADPKTPIFLAHEGERRK